MEPIRVRSASDELLLLEVLAASGEDVLELPSLVAVDDEDDLAFITAESEGELAPVSSIVDLERLLFDGDDDTFVRPVIAESETADQWRIQTPTGSITSGEHSTESPTDTESSRSARKPSTHTRRRAKEELEYLREQVQELKLQLAALKHPLAAESDGPETPAESQPPMALHTELWKRVAERQLAAKERAEAENAKLRHMLEGQLRIAQSLAKVLRKRSDASVRVVWSVVRGLWLSLSPHKLSWNWLETVARDPLDGRQATPTRTRQQRRRHGLPLTV